MHILEIKDLTVKVENKTILDKFNLVIKSGEVHAILGPNGTGKSTLSKVIMGDSNYKIVHGKIIYDKQDITNLPTDAKARLGIFLGFQMPVSIDGVSNADFLRAALHAKDEKFKFMEFIKDINAVSLKLKIDKEMIHRSINSGFSGGEMKKNEILQMHILKPSIVLLDEIDSGLDIDSIKIVSNSINEYIKKEQPGLLLITHYQRLLNYVKPNFVHIMKDGKIIKSGGLKLIKEIEENGYDNILIGE